MHDADVYYRQEKPRGSEIEIEWGRNEDYEKNIYQKALPFQKIVVTLHRFYEIFFKNLL